MASRRRLITVAAQSAAVLVAMLLSRATFAQSSDATGTAAPADTAAKSGATTDAPAKPSGIVAKVNGIPIFRRDIERDFENSTKGQKLAPEQIATLKANLLDQQVDQALLQDFLAAQKVSASKEEVESAMTQIRTRLKQQKSSLDDVLTNSGQTETAFRNQVGKQLAWNKFATSQMTDAQLQNFFKQFHERFDGTQRRVSHILLRPSGGTDPDSIKALVAQADDIRNEIKAGRISFEAAAEKYSAGPSRRQGGDLGFIPSQGVMVPQFSEAAFTLDRGEISSPVVTPFGVHLIKVTEIKPGTKTWRDVASDMKPVYAQLLLQQVLANQRKALQDKIEYTDDFPHFKPGTKELATPAAS